MFVIEMDDRRLLEDLANFLEYKLPGVVTRQDDGLAVSVHGAVAPRAQERILRRLLWAWQVEHKILLTRAPTFTHVAQPSARQV
jgi:hypothetical protein